MAEQTVLASEFRTEVAGGELVGRVGGQGPELLLLHGGPVSNYLEPLADELRDDYRVATYQQRGLEPSTLAEPYDVSTHLADVIAVLDQLGWERAIIGGHSWGGNLLMHLLATHPERVVGALVVDSLGGVGDGGFPAFDAEMTRRTPPEQVERAAMLDRRLMDGVATEAEAVESLRIFWPAYFPSPDRAPEFPDLRVNAASAGPTLQSAVEELPGLTRRLAGCNVPTVFVHGAASPMPVTASTDTAERIGAAASVVVVPDAGHFVWMDAPGCLREPLDVLVERAGLGGEEI
ncbi:alpha/beta fold hydrolase [Angustibacter sp. McL0619]|uniref:alpha/beta fold hydrolase n=1 Tax=Angustibacter sp. McL0619 TaxID=3415676 RepID=UPI003CF59C29